MQIEAAAEEGPVPSDDQGPHGLVLPRLVQRCRKVAHELLVDGVRRRPIQRQEADAAIMVRSAHGVHNREYTLTPGVRHPTISTWHASASASLATSGLTSTTTLPTMPSPSPPSAWGLT